MFTYHLKADKFIQSSFRALLMSEFLDLNEEALFNIALATGEALQNIVRYGYAFQEHKEVKLEIERADKLFTVNIIDDAPPCPIDRFMHQTYAPSDHGGMGLTIIKKLTHTFDIKPSNQGNCTTLVFLL
jgi:anti-sigma regulatory factor (Ser/Thr protein kinase)